MAKNFGSTSTFVKKQNNVFESSIDFNDINSISEAFKKQDVEKVTELVRRILSKKLGKVTRLRGIENFKKANGLVGVGIKLAIQSLLLVIRINFVQNKISGFNSGQTLKSNDNPSSSIHSIDIYQDNLIQPAYTIDLLGANINTILGSLIQVLKNPKAHLETSNKSESSRISSRISKGKNRFSEEEEKDLYNSNNYSKAITYLKQLEPDSDEAKQLQELIDRYLNKEIKSQVLGNLMQGIKAEVKAKKAQKEVSSESKKMNKFNVEFSDPKEIFKDLENLISTVVRGRTSSLVVAGSPGIGKTETIRIQLNDIVKKPGSKVTDYKYFKGSTSALGLYRMLFQYRNDYLLVFDDLDSIWEDAESVNLLKAALDSSKVKEITWNSTSSQIANVFTMSENEREEYNASVDEMMLDPTKTGKVKFPNQFTFRSKVVFITNLYEHELDSAIKSRSYVINIHLKPEDVISRIEDILPKLGDPEEDTMEIKQKVLAVYSKKIKTNPNIVISIRGFMNALNMYQSGIDDWERLAEKYSK